ncbi:monovalent cation/H+ antiporter complex subunit F [Oscillibacter sp.]|uniref:monovalent cation/H+ antiporter complex subunit F n=1 Tax=Oscillibacter sp. TaxID=1945593 RepID=UPI0028AC8028|nr:monovalent cation/H+ antiporter complex subunit F [Oscillibacter sp.]
MTDVKNAALTTAIVLLAVLMLATLVRAVIGPRFTDRIVAVNMINTMAVAVIAILSVRMGEAFLVDVALVYALLSFLTVIVMARMGLIRHWRKEKGTKTAPEKKETAEHGE